MKIPEMQQLLRRSSNAVCLIFFFLIYLSVNSCVSPKKFVYFNNLKEDPQHPGEITVNNTTQFVDPVIEPNDILSITIQTLKQNEETNKPLEAVSSSETGTGGFLVDRNGYVEIELVGSVKVAGLTTMEAKELIRQKVKQYYKDPVVRVRISNFEVTVLGDVAKPGVVKIASEKASIIDVLGLAGDLTITAKRSNILLSRKEGDKTKFVRLDMTSTDLYKSPYFYVRQRDNIYVEANTFKRNSSDNSVLRYLSYMGGLIGIVSFLFIARIIK